MEQCSEWVKQGRSDRCHSARASWPRSSANQAGRRGRSRESAPGVVSLIVSARPVEASRARRIRGVVSSETESSVSLEGSVSSRGGLGRRVPSRSRVSSTLERDATRLACAAPSSDGPFVGRRLPGCVRPRIGRGFVDFWAKISPQIGEPLIWVPDTNGKYECTTLIFLNT